MFRTENPVADWNAHCAEQERQLQKCPICSECGERITDDTCYQVNDELICKGCMDNFYMVSTDEFME